MDTPEEHEDSFEEMEPEFFLHDPDRDEETLSTQDLERLYQQALRAGEMLDAVEQQFPELTEGSPAEDSSVEANRSVSNDVERETSLNRPDVRPSQILEAALFVGGTTLTLKKLSRLLGDQITEEFVEREIQSLNSRYASQARPYEVTFGEGGYRMVLKSDFDRIRNRVYGLGPKEVKLSHHLLEMLAFVAYRQPVTREEVDESGQKNPGSLLNQLVRRELVSLERTGTNKDDIRYSTTSRFLEIFGLRSLNDLPHPDDFSFK